MVNVNGELLLCVSLQAALGLPSEEKTEPGGRPRLCVVGMGRERFAFCADEILGVRRVSRAGLRTVPVTLAKSPSAQTGWCFKLDDRNVGLIEEKKFFDSLDRRLRW
jgi:chemotaxis signal transduction protein